MIIAIVTVTAPHSNAREVHQFDITSGHMRVEDKFLAVKGLTMPGANVQPQAITTNFRLDLVEHYKTLTVPDAP